MGSVSQRDLHIRYKADLVGPRSSQSRCDTTDPIGLRTAGQPPRGSPKRRRSSDKRLRLQLLHLRIIRTYSRIRVRIRRLSRRVLHSVLGAVTIR